jgi:hypothetical protein
VATTKDIFGGMLDNLHKATKDFGGPVRFGRVVHKAEYTAITGKDFRIRDFGPKEGLPGASLLITLDKDDFAKAIKRAESYQNIPAFTGPEVMYKVGNFILGTRGPVQRAFRTESEPKGTPWDALSDTQKFYRGEGAKILDDSHRLKEIVTSPGWMADIAVSGPYARLLLGPEKLVGEDRFKFFTHMLGSDNGWGKGIKIPARPFFPESPNDLTKGEQKEVSRIVFEGIIQGQKDRAEAYGYKYKSKNYPGFKGK